MSYDFIDSTCPRCGTKFKRDPYHGTPCPKCGDPGQVYVDAKAAKRAAVAAHNAEYEKRRAAEAKETQGEKP